MFLFLFKLNFFWHSQALKSEGKKSFIPFESVFEIRSILTVGSGKGHSEGFSKNMNLEISK